MSTLKLHYDGWIALPAALRQTLGLNSGDRVEAEVVDGALVLRPASGARAKRAGVARTAPVAAADPSPSSLSLIDEEGRRAVPAQPAVNSGSAVTPRRRGRPPKAQAAVQPRPASHALVGIGPAKLIKKGELEKNARPEDVPPAPVARFRPERIAQADERRPFRNVEIRSLGPGRGHNSPRRLRPGSGA